MFYVATSSDRLQSEKVFLSSFWKRFAFFFPSLHPISHSYPAFSRELTAADDLCECSEHIYWVFWACLFQLWLIPRSRIAAQNAFMKKLATKDSQKLHSSICPWFSPLSDLGSDPRWEASGTTVTSKEGQSHREPLTSRPRSTWRVIETSPLRRDVSGSCNLALSASFQDQLVTWRSLVSRLILRCVRLTTWGECHRSRLDMGIEHLASQAGVACRVTVTRKNGRRAETINSL
jgi:hypothetical protein